MSAAPGSEPAERLVFEALWLTETVPSVRLVPVERRASQFRQPAPSVKDATKRVDL